jgi:hypothetical protein
MPHTQAEMWARNRPQYEAWPVRVAAPSESRQALTPRGKEGQVLLGQRERQSWIIHQKFAHARTHTHAYIHENIHTKGSQRALYVDLNCLGHSPAAAVCTWLVCCQTSGVCVGT